MSVRWGCVLWISLVLLVSPAAAANIVLNPGFETGVFTNWTQSGDLGWTGVDATSAHSGSYGAYSGPTGGYGYITQTLSTTPGASYQVSFWILNTDGSEGTYGFGVWWDGYPIYSEGVVGYYGWTQRLFGVVASGASTDLSFQFYNSPGFYYLDDVSVTEGVIPEPASLLLLGGGFLALCALRRRWIA